MIGRLTGKLASLVDQVALIDVNGVGYEVYVGAASIGETGEPATLWIHTHVREDQMTLFGFAEQIQKKVFLTLLGISGVGPKLAMAVVSQMSPQELIDAVAIGNAKLLTSVPGVGKKMAERIILELKDKLAGAVKSHQWNLAAGGADAALWRELTEALGGLGFTDHSVRNVITLLRQELAGQTPPLNQLLKLALQKIKNC